MSNTEVMLLEPGLRSTLRRRLSTTLEAGRGRLLTVLVIMALAVMALLAHYYIPFAWDVQATRALQSVKLPGLYKVMHLISGFGNAPKVIAITVVALLACNKNREVVFLTLSGLGGWLLSLQLKALFAHPRPTADLVAVAHQWPDGSFPSGHLVFYVCYFGFLFFMARERLPLGSLRRFVLILIALPVALVGISRVYLGEHWASDLPGSYLLGGLWLALSLTLYRRLRSSRKPKNDWYLPYRMTVR